MTRTEKLNNGLTNNKKMNNDVYQLRRKIMGYVYEARNLVNKDLPRIDVRITDNEENNNHTTLGLARMNGNVVWFPEVLFSYSDKDIKQTVYHEMCHAIFGIAHDPECPLMKVNHSTIKSDKKLNDLFIAYYKMYKGK